ncbi:hypothetical protein SMCF_8814, partial [Streptomyces coelicoflavus ZG0656]
MEHEVFVPVPAERLRDVLADPVRVARAVPGLQQDAGAQPVAGRLKVRIGSHSITYRGSLRLSAREDGTYAVEGEATESRGTGTVTLALTLRADDADGGATVTFTGKATADGRVTELPGESVTSAAARLLTRFAANLGAAAQVPPQPDPEAQPDETKPQPDPDPAPEPDPASDPDPAPDPEAHPDPHPTSVFDTEIPPPSLMDTDEDDEEADGDTSGDPSGDPPGDEGADTAPHAAGEPAVQPPAEAAHARRTMIGRSAEEVDHAPPRGRYAPVPAPQASAV